MTLSFCPACRLPAPCGDPCPRCGQPCTDAPANYTEKLLTTILNGDTGRMAMAVEVLTKWMGEARALIPLTILLRREKDPYAQVLAARGLGWLGDRAASPFLAGLLLDEDQPYVARIAAAQALARLGGETACESLQQAKGSPRASVAAAAEQALSQLDSRSTP